MSAVEHGGAPRGWLELSANLAPHGTPQAVRDAIARALYSTYADLDPTAAERHLAAECGIDPSWVLLTAGATEALRLAMDALVRPGNTVLIVTPTYGEYARLAERRGARVEEVRAVPPRFDVPGAVLARRIERVRPRLVVACDPNNPTGRLAGGAVWRRAIDALPTDSHLLVDESFLPFSSATARGLAGHERAIVVRSLTKVLAVPGIRAGYVVAEPSILARLRAVRDPWPVSAHACAAAAAGTWRLTRSLLRDLARWRTSTVALLRGAHLEPVPSRAPFVLAHVGPDARRLVAALARRRIAVRWCGSFGLSEHIRFAVRPPDEQQRLAAALREVRA